MGKGTRHMTLELYFYRKLNRINEKFSLQGSLVGKLPSCINADDTQIIKNQPTLL